VLGVEALDVTADLDLLLCGTLDALLIFPAQLALAVLRLSFGLNLDRGHDCLPALKAD
jgi:hypothetical protein